MCSDPARQALVDALDDLGERDRLSYAERTSWDEPYPPAFGAERLEALRRDQWWTKRLVFGILGGASIVLALGTWLGWPRSVLVSAIPFLVVPQLPTIHNLIRNGKAKQLYALLHQLEGEPTTESASPPQDPA